MPQLLLIAFVLLQVGFIVWGLRRKQRIYQFPFIAAVVWLGFLGPQMYGAVRNPHRFPPGLLRDGGLELGLLMSLLCSAMGYIGYFSKRKFRPPRKGAEHVNLRLIYAGSLVLGAIAFGGYYGLSTIPREQKVVFQGMPVVYNFFWKAIYPALVLALCAALKRPSMRRLLTVLVLIAPVIPVMVLAGRRGQTIVFLTIVAVSVYFYRRRTPPRVLVVCMIVLASLAVYVMPDYRGHAHVGGIRAGLDAVDVEETITDLLDGRKPKLSEFESGVMIMAAFRREGAWGLGRGFYNWIVRTWVPRLIVGDALKERLFVDAPDQDRLTMKYYSWVRPVGTIPMAPCDVFRQFHFFGAALYFLLGRLYRRLWHSAEQRQSVKKQIIYVVAAAMIPSLMVLSVTAVFATVLSYAMWLTPVLLVAFRNSAVVGHGVGSADASTMRKRVSRSEDLRHA